MNANEAVQAVEQWVNATIPELEGRTYDHVPAGKSKALPDCIIDVGREEVSRDDDEFAIMRLQQVSAVHIFRFGLSIMVEAGIDEAGAAAASATLRTLVARLLDGILQDATLGQRVDQASPFVSVDYTPPFIEYEDGTRGREVTIEMSVAEALIIED